MWHMCVMRMGMYVYIVYECVCVCACEMVVYQIVLITHKVLLVLVGTPCYVSQGEH